VDIAWSKNRNKLLVVVDNSGEIVAASWPTPDTPGAPTAWGVSLSDGEQAHEVEVPAEEYGSLGLDLSTFSVYVEDEEAGVATLVPKNSG
jgi:hypothetical protein